MIFDLQMMIESGSIYYEYQPVFDVRRHHYHSFEALLRFDDPYFGSIEPEAFVRRFITEDNSELQWRHLLSSAIEQMVKTEKVKIAVNVKQSFIKNEWFVRAVHEELLKHHMDGSRLIVELTEQEPHSTDEDTIEKLKSLKKIGVEIALDDFGIMHANFDALCHLPIDELKIDGKFIDNLRNQKVVYVVSSLVELANRLGMNVVAERVERLEQVRLLSSIGIRLMQGYHFSKPLENVSAFNPLKAKVGLRQKGESVEQEVLKL